MNEVTRFERKFLLSQLDYRKHRGFIEAFLQKDIHTGETGYSIRSLYFDTLSDSDYEDKIEGLEIRRKIRIRIYDPEGNFAWLEMKQKQGDHQLKRSLKIKKEEAQSMARGDYSSLLHYKEPFASECFSLMHVRHYRPKVIVDYVREAFTAPVNNTRVTFDREIRATEANFDLFSQSLNLYPVQEGDIAVLEVKYNLFLIDYIKDMVSECERSQISASKYCMGRIASFGLL